jgi:hypothetical protein
LQHSNYTLFLSLTAVVIYGLATRLIFGMQALDDFLGLATLGFICIFPAVLGFITVLALPRQYKASALHAALIPWIPGLVVVGIVMILAWEAWICVIMAAPIFFPLLSAGGLLMWAIIRQRTGNEPQMYALLFLALPYLVGLIESQLPTPDSIRSVERQIVINAPAEAVWTQIISVPQIQPQEHHSAFFRLAGVPKPVQAMLPLEPSVGPEEAVGMVRHSAYEGGLFFLEEVTAWQPGHGYRFTIDLNPGTRPPWPWNNIGGPAFDLLDGAYTIEPINEHQVILHLDSRHRLTTKLNAYGGLWTDFLLGDIQTYILRVVKLRAESAMN